MHGLYADALRILITKLYDSGINTRMFANNTASEIFQFTKRALQEDLRGLHEAAAYDAARAHAPGVEHVCRLTHQQHKKHTALGER